MKKLVALCGSLFLLLAACTSLPTEGPVHATRAPTSTNQNVGLHANGPREGDSPEDIVQGFLTASPAGFADDFEVARQFLSPQASESWRPLEEVRIYSDSRVPVMTRTDTQAVRLNLGSEGSLDESGRFTASSPEAVITTEFSLARNGDGEWRIISLDNGLLISATLFDTQYARSVLHFLTADSQYLVADMRWFPRNTYVSAAASELFAGPSDWLSDAVRTSIPAGTELGSRGISIESGTATVSLSEEALAVTGYQRALFQDQVEETLTMLSNVQNVELTIDGAPWDVNQSAQLSAYPYQESQLLVQVGGVPSLYRDGTATSLNMATVPANLKHLARGYTDNSPMVGISDSTLVTLPNDGSAPQTLIDGKDLAAPSVDIYDWVWTATTDNPGTLTAVSRSGEQVTMNAAWLGTGVVDSIHVSREGARAVVIWHTDTNRYMTATAIVRDGNGDPVAIDDATELGASIDNVTDVAWIDETTVAALATLPGSNSPAIYAIPIGGPISSLTEANGAVSITAGSGEGSLILATENGQILERSGGGWRLLLTDGMFPALAG